MMEFPNKLTVSASPHFHCGETTRSVMADVLLALLPAAVMSIVLFGWHCFTLMAVSVLSCTVFEYLTALIL